MLKKSFMLCLTVILIMSLAACTKISTLLVQHDTMAKHAIVGAVGGGVIGSATSVGTATGMAIGGAAGGLVGLIIERHQSLVQRLTAHGIQIVQMGDNVKLILPTDRFFHKGTPRLNASYSPVLTDVIILLNSFEKIDVRVIGFTDNVGSYQRNLALSRQQAQNLAHAMWDRGLDARVLYSEGCGEDYPIAGNATARGRAKNRRIEISLLQLPV